MEMAAILGGTALQVSQDLSEGKRAAKAGKYDQLLRERQAKRTERAGLSEQRRLKEAGRRLKGSQIVNIAARGGRISGTNLKAIVQSAAAIEQDAFTIARNTQFAAATQRYQGRLAKYKRQVARHGSRVRAATTFMKTTGKFYSLYGAKKKPKEQDA